MDAESTDTFSKSSEKWAGFRENAPQGLKTASAKLPSPVDSQGQRSDLAASVLNPQKKLRLKGPPAMAVSSQEQRFTNYGHWIAAVLIVVVGLVPRASSANLQFKFEKIIRAVELRETKMALSVANVSTGNQLVTINANEPMIPASNMKLVTTAAALHILGPEFVFQTELHAIAPHIWAGDAAPHLPNESHHAVLLVRGGGDPAFADPKMLEQYGDMNGEQLLETWVSAVRDAGIRRVAELVIDDRIFDRELVHPSWPRDQLNRWYCAEISGLNFYNNCLSVFPEPTQINQSPRIIIRPDVPFISTSNRAMTGTSDTFWIARVEGRNELTFMGKVKTQRNKPFRVTIHDPPTVFAHLLADRLRRAGIAVEAIGRVDPDTIIPDGHVLHVVQTTLPAVLSRCNKDSQNLYAEALIKRMGREVTGASGSWHSGAAAIRMFLHQILGARAAMVNVADGSGMSRDNQITAQVLIDLLETLHNDDARGPTFMDSLAIAGVDGTLHRRMSDLKGRVFAKSGYLNGVTSLSGCIVVPQPEGPEPKYAIDPGVIEARGQSVSAVIGERLCDVRARDGGDRLDSSVDIHGFRLLSVQSQPDSSALSLYLVKQLSCLLDFI